MSPRGQYDGRGGLVRLIRPGRSSSRFSTRPDAIDDGEESLADDGGAASRADGEDRSAVFEHDGGTRAGEGALARARRICFGSDKTEVVGDSGLDGKVIHLIVHDDAGAGDNDFRTEGGVDSRGAGDPIA